MEAGRRSPCAGVRHSWSRWRVAPGLAEVRGLYRRRAGRRRRDGRDPGPGSCGSQVVSGLSLRALAAVAGLAADAGFREPPLDPPPVRLYGSAIRRIEGVIWRDSKLA